MDFLQEMLKEKAGELISELTAKAGFDADSAERFVPAAGSATVQAVKSEATSLDLANLASSSNITSVLGAVDVNALAGKAGVSSSQSSAGIAAILPMVLSFMGSKAEGAGGVLALLGAGGGLGETVDKLKGLGGFLK